MKERGRVNGLRRIAVAFEDQRRLPELRSHLEALEDGSVRQVGMQAMATVMALAGKADAISVLENSFTESERTHFAGIVMNSLPFHIMDNPGRVASWLAENSDATARERNVVGFVSKWMQHDFNGASVWLDDQQEQPWYDEVVAEFVEQTALADPESSIDWAITITDSPLRQRVINGIIQQSPEATVYLREQGIDMTQ